MKRLTVFLVLLLTLSVGVLLTSCGCEAGNQAGQNEQNDQNDQTTTTTPNTGTNGSSSAQNGNGSSSAQNGSGSVAGDIVDGGEDIVDGVIEGGKDVMDGVDDALDGGVTYDDMVRNGRARDGDGFINRR